MSLSAASASTVTVGYATANGTATAGSDYVAASGHADLPGGRRPRRRLPVTVNGDTAVEPNETFFVNLSGATNATIADAQGAGRSRTTTCAGLRRSIDDVPVTEGNSGTVERDASR